MVDSARPTCRGSNRVTSRSALPAGISPLLDQSDVDRKVTNDSATPVPFPGQDGQNANRVSRLFTRLLFETHIEKQSELLASLLGLSFRSRETSFETWVPGNEYSGLTRRICGFLSRQQRRGGNAREKKLKANVR